MMTRRWRCDTGESSSVRTDFCRRGMRGHLVCWGGVQPRSFAITVHAKRSRLDALLRTLVAFASLFSPDRRSPQ